MSIETNEINERLVTTINGEHVISLVEKDHIATNVTVTANIDAKNGTHPAAKAAAEMVINFGVYDYEDSYDYAKVTITDCGTNTYHNVPTREIDVEVANNSTYTALLTDTEIYNALICKEKEPLNSDVVFPIIEKILTTSLSDSNINREDLTELYAYIRSILRDFPGKETTHSTVINITKTSRTAYYYHAPIRKGE